MYSLLTTILFGASLLLALPSWAQQEPNRVNKQPTCLIENLPACFGGVEAGRHVWVVDGASPGDCTVGGGAHEHMCVKAREGIVAVGGGSSVGGEAELSSLYNLLWSDFQGMNYDMFKQTYYFSPYSGDDSNSGRFDAPFQTLSKLKEMCTTYTRCVVRAGEVFGHVVVQTDFGCVLTPGDVVGYDNTDADATVIGYDVVSGAAVLEVTRGRDPVDTDIFSIDNCAPNLPVVSGAPISTIGDNGGDSFVANAEPKDAENVVILVESSDPVRPFTVNCDNGPVKDGGTFTGSGGIFGTSAGVGKVAVGQAIVENCAIDAIAQSSGDLLTLNVFSRDTQNFAVDCIGVMDGAGQYHVGETAAWAGGGGGTATVITWDNIERVLGLDRISGTVCPGIGDNINGVTSTTVAMMSSVISSNNNNDVTSHVDGDLVVINGVGSGWMRAGAGNGGASVAPTAASNLTLISQGTYTRNTDENGIPADNQGGIENAFNEGSAALIGPLLGGAPNIDQTNAVTLGAANGPGDWQFVRVQAQSSVGNASCWTLNPNVSNALTFRGWQLSCGNSPRFMSFSGATNAGLTVDVRGIAVDALSSFIVAFFSQVYLGSMYVSGVYDATESNFWDGGGSQNDPTDLKTAIDLANPLNDYSILVADSDDAEGADVFLPPDVQCDPTQACYQNFCNEYRVDLPACVPKEVLGYEICSFILNKNGGNRGAR